MIFLLWQFCYSTLAAPTPNATYSDVLARTKMLPLASAAYSKWPQDCLTNRFTNAVLKRRLDVECDPVIVDTCSGYSAVLNDDKAIVLGFRGTSGFLQLLEEADQSVLMRQSPWIAGGKVSKYFNTAFMDLWNAGIKDDFIALISQYPSYRIWVTGHSLGGAVASLAASYIIAANLTSSGRVQLVTFGQPRTGDNDFAHAHDKQMMDSFRVTHWRDIVPHIPPKELEHYHHHKYEVFYYNNMREGATFKVCQADEDNECSDGLGITTSIFDHLHYFDVDVSHYGTHGCR